MDQHKILRFWQKRNWLTLLLVPVSLFFYLVIFIRRLFYKIHLLKSDKPPVPVIVVGNIYIGGTGKTPFVIWLCNWLKSRGYKPGVVSRGYGGDSSKHPLLVTEKTLSQDSGDEPQEIFQATNVPVMVGRDRLANAFELYSKYKCNIIISDDGLQHYRLARDYEFTIFDGSRGKGNGLLFPAGPLREPMSRAVPTKVVINGDNCHDLNGDHFYLRLTNLINLLNGEVVDIHEFTKDKIHAVAGIGNPQRFFNDLRAFGFDVIPHIFPDHYDYSEENLEFNDDIPVIMTGKDSVKCRKFANRKMWIAPVSITVDSEIESDIDDFLKY